jgi:hypothetical protein
MSEDNKMEHEKDFIEVFLTYDPMEAKLVQARLSDAEIPFSTLGDTELTLTLETFNSSKQDCNEATD